MHGPCKKSLLASTLAEEELCSSPTALEIAETSIESRDLSSVHTPERHLGKKSSIEVRTSESLDSHLALDYENDGGLPVLSAWRLRLPLHSVGLSFPS